MTQFNRLMTLLRGRVRASTDAVLDANALALLDQQLFDTEQALIRARRDLAALMAERTLADKQYQRAHAEQQRYESHALAALRQDNPVLAEETAGRVAELEEQCHALQGQIAGLRDREAEFRAFIAEAGQTLASLRQQQALARVSERMQRSTRTLAGGSAGLQQRLDDSRATLARIQERQDRARAEWQAHQQLDREAGHADLDARLEQAGILHGRRHAQEQILARLKEKLGSMDGAAE